MTDAGKLELWRRFACAACRHYRPGSGSCAAFPGGIPIEIASGQLDHVRPRGGDGGTRFEPEDAAHAG